MIPPSQLFALFEKDPSRAADQCFTVGGDCSYSLRGKRKEAVHPGGGRNKLSHEEGEAAEEEQGEPHENNECTLNIKEGLRQNDRVTFIAEWSGDLVVLINGEQVGRCPNALEPADAVRPLYGVVDLYAHGGGEDHNVRAVSLISEAQMVDSTKKDATEDRRGKRPST